MNSQIELENKAKLKLFAFHSALGEDSGIYSPDETPETFGLFDRAIEEERDERLQFLSILRDFKDENPDEFRRIKNLPLRSRCGRATTAADLTNGSLAFIRNERRDAFYRVSYKELGEIGFIEMARAFRAEVAEKAAPLHERHHDDVRGAVVDFREKLEADAAEKAWLTAAQHTIKLAKFQDLPRKLNKLQRDASAKSGKPIVSTAVYLDKLMQIIRSYPLEIEDVEETGVRDQPVDLTGFEPKIILSESFVSPS